MASYESTPPAFRLIPSNTAAKLATRHEYNASFQYAVNYDTFGLWLDFSSPERQATGYTLGRGYGVDIYLPDARSRGSTSQLSDQQASFKYVPQTGAILLVDNSIHRNTEPCSSSSSQSYTIRFRSNTNSVLIARGINTRIAFGRDKWYQFDIQWDSDGLYQFPSKTEPYMMGPTYAKHKRYIEGDRVGGGAYGSVFWALDATSGQIVAVKRFHNMMGKNSEFAAREVANLSRVVKSSTHHEHVLEILDYATGTDRYDNEWGEIFMPLKLGNLATLITKRDDVDHMAVSERVLRQMLLALQCIASHKIIHRDLKPENILWEYDAAGDYHFTLGDFGLSTDPKIARTVAGTEPFMAPEVLNREKQSTKVDVWSLFATYTWVRNTQGFRDDCGGYDGAYIHSWLQRIGRSPEFLQVNGMARRNPKERLSAEEQLAVLDGLMSPPVQKHGSASTESDMTADLESQFGGMDLGDFQPTAEFATAAPMASPELAYYEPYSTNLMEDWQQFAQAGPSNQPYMPPVDEQARVPRQDPEEWAALKPQYPSTGDDETVVPDQWGTIRMATTDMEDPSRREQSGKRKNKGKQHKK